VAQIVKKLAGRAGLDAAKLPRIHSGQGTRRVPRLPGFGSLRQWCKAPHPSNVRLQQEVGEPSRSARPALRVLQLLPRPSLAEDDSGDGV